MPTPVPVIGTSGVAPSGSPVIGFDGTIIGWADGRGGTHVAPGTPAYSETRPGVIIGFADGYGGVGDADTIKKMYDALERRSMRDDVVQRIDQAVLKSMADAVTDSRTPAGDGAGPGGILEAGRGVETPRGFGVRTAEREHILTRAWLTSHRGRSGGIDPAAMEGLLRSIGVNDYFRVRPDGKAVDAKGNGIRVDFEPQPDGGIKLNFIWKA